MDALLRLISRCAAAFGFASLIVSSAFAQQNPPAPPPDQAHAMSDVGYHFANLWFAATNENWPLAKFYLDETRSHLQWAVAIRPVRKTSAGEDIDLKAILAALNDGLLPPIQKAIDAKDANAFKTAYRNTMMGCYGCHAASEKPFLRVHIPDAPPASIIDFVPPGRAVVASAEGDAASRGREFFQQNCALCHATGAGGGNTMIGGQGPSLVGVVGRRAASAPNFNYSKPLSDSGLTWDAATLDRFLANPPVTVPGTMMLVSIPAAENRKNVIAFLSTLKAPANAPRNESVAVAVPHTNTPGDYFNDHPGLTHRIDLAALPAPFATTSAGNGPRVVKKPADAKLSVPPGFKVSLFASGLRGPRLIRTAPNGDIFIAETGELHLRVLRAPNGAEAPVENKIFADDLNRPFGIAFYPPGPDPKWIYVANNNSVVRLPYHNGDLAATGAPEVIVPKLADTTGGHTSRDVAFSKDGKRMFISVGSGSNAGEEMKKMPADEIASWEAAHGLGAAWGPEANRANILVTDPEGKEPLRVFVSGVRNGVTLVTDDNGVLWTATNERDGLGDDLVPDYISRIKEGAYYGWPWYYLGNHEDPRHAGERPDLAGKATVPDILLQAHSASLEMTFYPNVEGPSAFPAEYRGDIFAALHGSWNRSTRTGYKVVRARLKNGVPTGEYEDFLVGFVVDNTSVWGRPVGVTVAHDGSLLVSDDGNGTLWRVAYAGK